MLIVHICKHCNEGFAFPKKEIFSMVNWFPCTYGGGRNLVKRGHLEIEFSECPDLQAV